MHKNFILRLIITVEAPLYNSVLLRNLKANRESIEKC